MRAPYTPTSGLAEKLLREFHPHRTGMIKAEAWADYLDIPVEDVERCLDELLQAGLVEPAAALRPASPQRRLQSTPLGWRAREDLLRSRGLRHPTLMNQAAFNPKDLIVGILAHAHHREARMKHGMGLSTGEQWEVVAFYLDSLEPAELEVARDGLLAEQLVVPASPGHIDLSRRGLKRYRTEIAPRLNLGPDESILDEVLDQNIEVFFSWQSEFSTSRNLIKGLLDRTIKKLNDTKRPTRPLHLMQSTAIGDGAVRIDVQLMQRINDAHLFVADVTAVTADKNRHRLNDNVLLEVGYALASKEPSRILLLALKRDDLGPGAIAFDLAHVQRIELGPDGKRDGRVQAEIERMLQKRGWLIG